MLKFTVHREDITSFLIYEVNNIATIFLNQYGSYNKTQAEIVTPYSQYKQIKEKMSKNIENLNNKINKKELMDMYQILLPENRQYTFFSNSEEEL